MKRKVLSQEESDVLFARVATGDIAARNEIVMANMGLVGSIAKSYLKRGFLLDDLIGEGSIGLIRAVEEFDPNAGTTFSTYAVYWIKQTIIAALQKNGSMIRIPVHVLVNIGKILQETRSGKRPAEDFESMVSKANLPDSQKKLMMRASGTRNVGALSQDSYLEATSSSKLDEDFYGQLALVISEIDALSEPKRTILRLRYGLDGGEALKLHQIGERVGLSRTRVIELQKDALGHIRGRLAS